MEGTSLEGDKAVVLQAKLKVTDDVANCGVVLVQGFWDLGTIPCQLGFGAGE